MKSGQGRGSNLAKACQPLDLAPCASPRLEPFSTKLSALVVSSSQKDGLALG